MSISERIELSRLRGATVAMGERALRLVARGDEEWTGPPSARPAIVAIEAAVASFVFAGVPALLWGRSGSPAGLGPHPGWIAVLVLSARYGNRGLLLALSFAAAAVGLVSISMGGTGGAGGGLAPAWGELQSGSNVGALLASLVVAWIASHHGHVASSLGDRMNAMRERALKAEAAARALEDAVEALRTRADRAAASLGFLRDVATRLEGVDPVAAAQAAVDLAIARTGARGALVRIRRRDGLQTLAARGASGSISLAPRDVSGTDLCAPIRSGGEIVGLLALTGVPHAARNQATSHDLALIAAWCGRALARTAVRPAPQAVEVSRPTPEVA